LEDVLFVLPYSFWSSFVAAWLLTLLCSNSRTEYQSLSNRNVPFLLLGEIKCVSFSNCGRTFLRQQHGAKLKGMSR